MIIILISTIVGKEDEEKKNFTLTEFNHHEEQQMKDVQSRLWSTIIIKERKRVLGCILCICVFIVYIISILV